MLPKTKNAQALSQLIRENQHLLLVKSATLGFDGFVDSLVRVNRSKSNEDYFQTIRSFGEYTLDKSEGSFSLELSELTEKGGGNMPNVAYGLAQLGARVTCIGAMGYPELHPAFSHLTANCVVGSVENPGRTTALEFNDGKIILGQMKDLNHLTWNRIAERVGVELLQKVFSQADLIALLNWGEIKHATELWQNTLALSTQAEESKNLRTCFLDLSDCSMKSPEELMELLDSIRPFIKVYTITLSLNKNETALVSQALGLNKGSTGQDELAFALHNLLGFEILLRQRDSATISGKQGTFTVDTVRIDKPLITTGAGDNFNAGFCLGIMLGLHPADCAILGHATASAYMTTGNSPNLNSVLKEISVAFNPQHHAG